MANPLFWLYQLVILVAVGVSLFFYLRRYYTQFQPYCIRCDENSAWFVAIGAEDFQTMQILPSSVITVWLIVLHFQLENGKHHSLIILHDALNDKDYRALVVMLKIAGLPLELDS